MPNVPVTSTPVQISQSITQAANIQNTGNVTVYLDDNTAVSSLNYGMEVPPLSSVGWPAERDLWAVTASGNGMLSVLYGASGVTQSEVTAVVTGDVTATIDGPVDANITNASIAVTGNVNATVTNATIPVTGTVNANITNANIPVTGNVNANITNANIDATVTGNIIVDSGTVQVGGIDTPVMVQGGGSVLLNTTGSLTAGNGVTLNVPAPASGLTYFGIGVIVRVTSKTISNDAPLEVWVDNYGPGPGPTIFQALRHNTNPVEYIGEIGKARIGLASMVVPVGSTFPIDITLFNEGVSGTQNFSITVIGVSYADTYPRDFLQWEDGVEPREVFTNTVAGAYVVLSPSLETRSYLLSNVSATAGGNFEVQGLTPTGSWSITQNRAHNSLYGNAVPGANIPAGGNSIITIPGNGVAHRIVCANALTGSVTLAYLGKA